MTRTFLLRLDRAIHWVVTAGAIAIASVCLLAIAAAIFTEVITRYLFGISYGQIPENAIILFGWVAFLSLAKATAERRHISITLLPEILARRPRARDALECVNHLLVILFATLFLYSGAVNALAIKASGLSSQLPFVLPSWVFPLALPVGMCLLIYSSARAVVALVSGLLTSGSR